MSAPVVALDGPAGSGKSTVASAVARALGVPHVDTGAMYRAVTLKALRAGVAPSDARALAALLPGTDIDLVGDRVLLDGVDESAAIRSPPVTASVSQVAAQPAVRAWLLDRQRALVSRRGGVMEGRDIGTMVLPDAPCKVFLTADAAERARRRAAELRAGGAEASDASVRAEIEARDQLDSSRAASPLRVADGAVVIDSTGRSVEDVVAEIVGLAGGGARG
ncbi:MAG TPA: (d)CMP kinase [Actinomycetota bacterium]|nr:(d)CMP kinase [Actinomycetota bacterium]